MKNKPKILLSATRLFNQNGFVNVRLQHISDDAIISVGNIAYHFKNKEAIVRAIFEDWEKHLKDVLIEYRHTPIFANVDRIFAEMEQMQTEYSFFFTDLIEIKRAYPEIFARIQQFFQWQFILVQEIIRFNVARGAMTEMKEPEMVFLTEMLVERIITWPGRSLIWQKELNPDKVNLSAYCWKIINPYLSKGGDEELTILLEQKIRLKPDNNTA